MQVIRATVETALDWGCPYVIYWQLYDNESHVTGRRPDNHEVRGFYLIRPDGTPAEPWAYFRNLLQVAPDDQPAQAAGSPSTAPASP